MNDPHMPAKLIKKKMPVPAMVFPVKPEPGNFAFTVKIFWDRKGMRRYLKQIRPEFQHRRDYAFTDETRRLIVLNSQDLDHATVTHEMVHAALWWSKSIHMKPVNCWTWKHPSHERIAEAVCQMTLSFWRQFHEKPLDLIRTPR